MPTTPWCHSRRNRHSVYASGCAASAARASRSASASSCIVASTSRRSRFSRSSSAASGSAAAAVGASRQRMPTVMSESRPAALRRGPATKPRSKAVARRASRPATANSAAMPGRALPARILASPCATSVRLTRSSRTTSATVPSATRSSSVAKLGSGRVAERPARAHRRARREQHVEHHADAGEMPARERASRLVRVDDQRRRGKRGRRQVVVGDQDLDAERGGRGDAVVAGDAVVDRHDEARRFRVRGARRSRA